MKMTLSQRCGVPALSRPMPTRGCVRRSPVVARVAQDMPSDDEAFWNTEEQADAQLFDSMVQAVSCKDIAKYSADGWTLLDVRPETEIEKAQLSEAVEVPLFSLETGTDPVSIFKRLACLGQCGWWLGAQHMTLNENFVSEVEAKVPKDAKVMLACQQGLRSKAAVAQLAKAGYKNLAWVDGGLNKSKPGEVATKGGIDVRTAGIGGVSSMIRWTPLQNENTEGLGGWWTPLAIVAVLWLINILTLSYELQPMMDRMQAGLPFQ